MAEMIPYGRVIKIIRCNYIIEAVQEYLQDVDGLESADPGLVAYDLLSYMGLTDEMIREAVGERIYRKATAKSNFEVVKC